MSDYAARYMLFFALSLMACGAARGDVPSDTSEQGRWGEWGPVESCPQGQYVWGFRVKGEPWVNNGDDTALNAVQLICKSGVNGAAHYIKSLEGEWGRWGRDHVCGETPATAFAIQVEPYQGQDKETSSIDDTAAGNIKMKCGSEILVGDPPAAWGNWTGFYSCPDGQKITGFRTKVEPEQGTDDDTAMNAMQVYCRN